MTDLGPYLLGYNDTPDRAGSGAGGVVAMTLVARTIRAAARGLVNTSPPSWLRKLAFPVRPAELGPVKRKGKKVTG